MAVTEKSSDSVISPMAWRLIKLSERQHRLLKHILSSALEDGYLKSDMTRKLLHSVSLAKKV